MIDIKATGVSGPKPADRKKPTSSSSSTGGVSFANLLSEASATPETTPVSGPSAFNPVAAYTPLNDGDDDGQPDAKKHASRLMETLTQLAEDALSGAPTAALGKLQSYLATTASNKNSMTPEQQQVLNEVETRAAVEAEKLKS